MSIQNIDQELNYNDDMSMFQLIHYQNDIVDSTGDTIIDEITYNQIQPNEANYLQEYEATTQLPDQAATTQNNQEAIAQENPQEEQNNCSSSQSLQIPESLSNIQVQSQGNLDISSDDLYKSESVGDNSQQSSVVNDEAFQGNIPESLSNIQIQNLGNPYISSDDLYKSDSVGDNSQKSSVVNDDAFQGDIPESLSNIQIQNLGNPYISSIDLYNSESVDDNIQQSSVVNDDAFQGNQHEVDEIQEKALTQYSRDEQKIKNEDLL